MSQRVIYTCDRCKEDCQGVHTIDIGKDYSKPRDPERRRIVLEVCEQCWQAIVRFCKVE